jgi:hypothetical protein
VRRLAARHDESIGNGTKVHRMASVDHDHRTPCLEGQHAARQRMTEAGSEAAQTVPSFMRSIGASMGLSPYNPAFPQPSCIGHR